MDHPDRLEAGHPFRQWKTWQIPGTQLTLSGYSRANDKTFFHVAGLRCCLDAGLCEGRQVDTVFLTHTHHDHSKDLDYLAAKESGVDIYLPAEAVSDTDAFLRASARLNHGPAYDPGSSGTHRLHGVRGGDEFVFGRRGHHVRVARCEHKVPSVGYAFAERGKQLLPMYETLRRSLTAEGRGAEFGHLIAAKRKEGVRVEQETLRPLFAFLGDTDVSVFARNPWLFTYPVIITECTFLYDSELERANRIGHTVWSRLEPVIAAHPETLFILTHFSLRHSDSEVLEFFRTVAGRLANVMPWVHPESLMPEQHQRLTAPTAQD
ncbi:MBL fold metallo-hydrolase [Nocardia cyriacigeorgica]|uniref:MBL fold metallo-hydrolase n=1 Tax=Nocardia cyriacigeorgica TaxID=135487 RepID=UPI001892D5B2|nr:MBL fold metallo-hydrolase [Nocardia cyriacigeorgica]MBF6397452.1 MBL fold metallo-hydrolase [Nocardia cyriacigeorgica]MBF6402890.1 MBL fold metallo-hydrolase [Nocardia cyriacigeorgica]